MIGDEPMTLPPAVTEMSPEPESVVVATFANVFTPEKYGMLPTTADEEVESPPKDIALDERKSGKEKVSGFS